MSKTIYTFTVDNVVKVPEKTEEKYKDKDGNEKTRTITEEIEKNIPIEIKINKPNRKQMQEAEMVFSIEMSRCIKMGIVTKAMLLNNYTDAGGLVSKKDMDHLKKAYKEFNKLHDKITEINLKPEKERTEKEKKTLKTNQEEVAILQKQIVESEASYLTLFNHTADTKAQNKIILWYILFLTYFKDPSKNHEDFVEFFEGKDFEEKEEFLYEMEEKEDEMYQKIYSKLATIVSFWYFSGKTDKKEIENVLAERNEEG